MMLRNPQLVDAMAAPAEFSLEVAHGTPFELLIELYANPARSRRVLDAVGDRSGELWLHLLGLALEAQARDAPTFVEHVAGVRAVELRKHVLGLYVPSWQRLVGEETIARAVRGDAAAAKRLLSDDRYYGGSAASLRQLLPLSAQETKARVVEALAAYVEEVFTPREPALQEELAVAAAENESRAAHTDRYDLIERVAVGYRYVAEPEFPRVVLIPQLAASPSILLCQHLDARLICYPVRSHEADLLAVGRALGDRRRIAILERARAGDATLAELAASAGLAKSTTHHHLTQLRAAGLIGFRGNADGYFYSLNEAGFEAAARLLATFS